MYISDIDERVSRVRGTNEKLIEFERNGGSGIAAGYRYAAVDKRGKRSRVERDGLDGIAGGAVVKAIHSHGKP